MLLPKILFGIAAVAALLIFGIRFIPPQASFFTQVALDGVSVSAEVAMDSVSRAKGLSGRSRLGENEGMLFWFENPDRHAIWMKDMRFPIDILWIRKGRVVDVVSRAPAPSPGTPDSVLPVYRPREEAEWALEVSAGFTERHGIRAGDAAHIGLEEEKRKFVALSPQEPLVPPSTAVAGEEGDPPIEVEGRPRTKILRGEPGEEFFIETLRGFPPRGRDF